MHSNELANTIETLGDNVLKLQMDDTSALSHLKNYKKYIFVTIQTMLYEVGLPAKIKFKNG